MLTSQDNAFNDLYSFFFNAFGVFFFDLVPFRGIWASGAPLVSFVASGAFSSGASLVSFWSDLVPFGTIFASGSPLVSFCLLWYHFAPFWPLGLPVCFKIKAEETHQVEGEVSLGGSLTRR